MSLIKEKLKLYPQEQTINHYYSRAVTDCPQYPLTLNEIRKWYWKQIKLKKMVDIEQAYQKRIEKHLKYVKSKIKNNTAFKPEIIGEIIVKDNSVTFICDEHNDIIVSTDSFTHDWLLKTISVYEQERCVNIVDNKIITRMDISK